MSSYDQIVRICGRTWKDVTNETTSGPVYSLRHILSSDGEPEKSARSD